MMNKSLINLDRKELDTTNDSLQVKQILLINTSMRSSIKMNKEFDINTPRIFELEDVDHDEDVEFEANNYISTQMLE